MKSYAQYCGLARGLDLVGDRWTLLIIRELAIGDRRYSQLQHDLRGIPTNLLAHRLRALTSAELVEPIAGGAGGYSLTAHGRELVPTLHAFVRWATPTMLDGPSDDDHQDIRWLAFATSAYVRSAPGGPSVTLLLTCGGERLHLTSDAGAIAMNLDDDLPADVTVDASMWALMGLISGVLALDQIRLVDDAATVGGTAEAMRRVRQLLATPR